MLSIAGLYRRSLSEAGGISHVQNLKDLFPISHFLLFLRVEEVGGLSISHILIDHPLIYFDIPFKYFIAHAILSSRDQLVQAKYSISCADFL